MNVIFFFIYIFLIASLYAEKPDLLLLNIYSNDINVTAWYMIARFDGASFGSGFSTMSVTR